MMGGALGNLVDRIFRDPGVFVGGVVDFVAVEKFAIFNVADAAITIAAIAIVFLTVFRVDETKNKNGI
jgi:signal peptidase II